MKVAHVLAVELFFQIKVSISKESNEVSSKPIYGHMPKY